MEATLTKKCLRLQAIIDLILLVIDKTIGHIIEDFVKLYGHCPLLNAIIC